MSPSLRSLPEIEDDDNSRVSEVIKTKVINQRVTGITIQGQLVVVSLENGVDLLFDFAEGSFKVGVMRVS